MNKLRSSMKRKSSSPDLKDLLMSPSRRKEEEREKNVTKVDEYNEFGQSKLHQLVMFCEIENVRRLCETCNVNILEDGKTALHCAAENGYWDICLLLIEQHASLTLEDPYGSKPINSLAKSIFRPTHGSLKVLTILAGINGVHLNNPTFKLDRKKEIPLHTATGRGSDWLVRFLLENGSDINAQTEQGSTALHYAIGTDNLQTAKVLLELNANYNIKDKNNISFLDSIATKPTWMDELKEFLPSLVLPVLQIGPQSHIHGSLMQEIKSSRAGRKLSLDPKLEQKIEDLAKKVKISHSYNSNASPRDRDDIDIMPSPKDHFVTKPPKAKMTRCNSDPLTKINKLTKNNDTTLDELSAALEIQCLENSLRPLYQYNTINEFIVSEERLYHFLEISKTEYIEPIQNIKSISEEDKQFIISKFQTAFKIIHTFSTSLTEYKEDVMLNPASKKFSEALLTMVTYLKLFNTYCREYDNLVHKIKELKKMHPEFLKLLEEGNKVVKQDIASILIMPIQRVMRYPLLLEAILKEVPETHSEYQVLVDVYSEFKKYAQVIDHDSAIVTQRMEVVKVLKKFAPEEKLELLQAHRYLVFEGDLKILTGDDKAERRRVFIFNDMIFIAKYLEQEEKRASLGNSGAKSNIIYKFNMSFSWTNSSLFMLPDVDSGGGSPLITNAFQIMHSNEISKLYYSYTFIAENSKEKSIWVEKIRECLSRNQQILNDLRGDNLKFTSVEGYLSCKKGQNSSEKFYAQLKGVTIFLYSSRKSHSTKDKIILSNYKDMAIGRKSKKILLTLVPNAISDPMIELCIESMGQSWIKEISYQLKLKT